MGDGRQSKRERTDCLPEVAIWNDLKTVVRALEESEAGASGLSGGGGADRVPSSGRRHELSRLLSFERSERGLGSRRDGLQCTKG